ncbi:hypothetical protein CsSME_00052262 [Camellia sinensis var. sinensis]
MASIVANLPSPLTTSPKFTVSATEGAEPGFHHWRGQRMGLKRQSRVAIVVKATGESSESSTSLSIVKSVQNVWDSSENRLALIGLGFAAVVAVWASANLITWFIYRYLLFKPDREELLQTIKKSVSDILGQ